MLDSLLLYFGAALFAGGALTSLRRRTRRPGVIVAASGAVMMAIALALPVREQRITTHTTKLDEWMPVWQFDERHEIDVAAPPERVYAAIHAVSADEIALFRTLTTIRRGFRKADPNILNAPKDEPLLEVATKSGFIWLADDAPHEMVVGTVVVAPPGTRRGKRGLTPDVFQKTLPPGFAIATMNFLVTPDARGGSRVTTETRVYANDPASQRAFAKYWRIIHPGSDIIRRMWLRAVKRRAEQRARPAA
ncbi:MAG: hypothetical protein ABI837_16300 [Acidobacteriota bacterium]